MKCTILAIGNCKEAPIQALIQTYIKRLQPWLKTSVLELPTATQLQENATLQSKIPARSVVIGLDETGKSLSSRQFAQQFEKWQVQGESHVCFLIGGADGLTPETREKCHVLLSLSAFTFPHMLVRPIILEQLYRGFSILNNHPYHRD